MPLFCKDGLLTMPREYNRTRRIAELLQRELAMLIARDLDDPRIGMVTITGVDVTKDLALAKVFVTRLGEAGVPTEIVAVLNHAAGYLRRRLSDHLDMRVTPELLFRYDQTVEKGLALSQIIDRAVSSDAQQDSEE